MADTGHLSVTVAHSPGAALVREWVLELPAGATVRQALQASGISAECPGLDLDIASLGVWGRPARLNQTLQDQDRIEVYRPLLVDPKVARRERFRAQGSKVAGLFSQRRPGAKPGY